MTGLPPPDPSGDVFPREGPHNRESGSRESRLGGGETVTPDGAAPPSSRLRRFLGLALRLLVTGVVTWFIVRAVGLNLQELQALDWSRLEPRWGPLVLSVAVLLLGYLYSAGLWGHMVWEMGGPKVPIFTALRVFFTANLGRYIPGKLWQIAGLAFLARREGVSAGTATGAAFLGQLFSLGGATLVGLGVLIQWEAGGAMNGGWVAGGVLAIMILATFPRILRPLLHALLRKVKAGSPGPLWPDQAFGVRWLVLYAISWLLQGLAFRLLMASFGVGMGWLQGLAVFPAAYLLGYIAFFAPAGLGIREGFLIFFLTPVAGPLAAVLAVLARLWTTVVELVPALLLAGGYMRDPKPDGSMGGRGG